MGCTFFLVLVDGRCLDSEGDLIRACGESVETLVEVVGAKETGELFSELCNCYLKVSWMIFLIFYWPGLVLIPKASASLSRKGY